MKIPETTCIYVIADIHGRADLLARLLRAIEKDAGSHAKDRRILITLGDYVDRGPQSRQVIDLLSNLPLSEFEAKHLKGNHEDMLLAFLEAPIENGPLWLGNGGWATLMSYGFEITDLPDTLEAMPDARDKLLTLMPKEHAHFFKSLRLTYQLGDYFFAHAGVRPGVELDQQIEEDLIWIRGEFLHSSKDFGKIVVHGHSISRTPQEMENRIGLDTGAFHTGVLTCMVLNGENRYFIQIKEDTPKPIHLESKKARLSH